MWTLKVRFYNKNFVNILANKYKVTSYGYPLNTFFEKKIFYVTVAGKIFGEEKNKKLFIKGLKKAKEVKHIEVNDDFAIMCVKQPIEIAPLYTSGFIYIEPAELTTDFYQVYYLGSWDRKKLSVLISMKFGELRTEVLQFKKENIKDISITGISPLLTEKQKKAFDIAYKRGYYNFPRGTELKDLSKLMKISLSTYQAHLRKAEKKITNFFYRYIK